MDPQLDIVWKLLSAFGVGLLIGTERGLFNFLAGFKKSTKLLWMILIISAGGIMSVWLFV